MKKREIKQRDIYMCDLTQDSIDSEQKNIHPVVVVSIDIRNSTSPNVYIFPITHSNKKTQPTHIILNKIDYPFFTYNVNTVICEEGRSISKKRLERFLGEISKEDLDKILECKEYVFIEKY